jgi:SAM-dependent methyltransferase
MDIIYALENLAAASRWRKVGRTGDRRETRRFGEYDAYRPVVSDPYSWKGKVGESWARDYARTDRSFAGLTAILVDRIRAMSPSRLLDIGCGAGETSIAIGRSNPKSDILGIDLSEPLVAVARRRGRPLKNVRFANADASSWRDQAFVPDTLMSRHGVMFFDNPVKAFTNLNRASQRGAQLIFSCFRDRSENLWASEIGKLIDSRSAAVESTAPGPFAFADKCHVTRILAAAGWEKIAFEAIDWDYVAGDGSDSVYDAVGYFQRIGPAAAAVAELKGTERDALISGLADLATRHFRDGQVAFKAGAWIVTAQAE